MGATKKSLGVTGMACRGRLCVQDGRSVAVVAEPTAFYKRKRKKGGLQRNSEGLIVPIEDERQQNDIRGKWPYFVEAARENLSEMIA
jgi:hypothetical protein